MRTLRGNPFLFLQEGIFANFGFRKRQIETFLDTLIHFYPSFFMKSISLYTKINSLPERLKSEVSDFVDFLLTKKKKDTRTGKRVAGFLKGKIEISSDFDKPLDDFKEYM